jgi:hypothetical protein
MIKKSLPLIMNLTGVKDKMIVSLKETPTLNIFNIKYTVNFGGTNTTFKSVEEMRDASEQFQKIISNLNNNIMPSLFNEYESYTETANEISLIVYNFMKELIAKYPENSMIELEQVTTQSLSGACADERITRAMRKRRSQVKSDLLHY